MGWQGGLNKKKFVRIRQVFDKLFHDTGYTLKNPPKIDKIDIIDRSKKKSTRFFEPGLGRIAKTTSDSVSEPKK